MANRKTAKKHKKDTNRIPTIEELTKKVQSAHEPTFEEREDLFRK